jgi:hypothetical protein
LTCIKRPARERRGGACAGRKGRSLPRIAPARRGIDPAHARQERRRIPVEAAKRSKILFIESDSDRSARSSELGNTVYMQISLKNLSLT